MPLRMRYDKKTQRLSHQKTTFHLDPVQLRVGSRQRGYGFQNTTLPSRVHAFLVLRGLVDPQVRTRVCQVRQVQKSPKQQLRPIEETRVYSPPVFHPWSLPVRKVLIPMRSGDQRPANFLDPTNCRCQIRTQEEVVLSIQQKRRLETGISRFKETQVFLMGCKT